MLVDGEGLVAHARIVVIAARGRSAAHARALIRSALMDGRMPAKPCRLARAVLVAGSVS